MPTRSNTQLVIALHAFSSCVQGRELWQPKQGGARAGEPFEGPNLRTGGSRKSAGQPEGMARGEHHTL